MKKLIFLFAFVVMALGLTAQDAIVRTSKVYVAKGAAGDTINNAVTKNFVLLVTDYAVGLRLQVEQTALSGTANTTTYVEGSLDNSKWFALDTVTVSGNNKTVGALVYPYCQYIRFRTVGTTGAQTTRYKYTYLIEKKP